MFEFKFEFSSFPNFNPPHSFLYLSLSHPSHPFLYLSFSHPSHPFLYPPILFPSPPQSPSHLSSAWERDLNLE